MLKWLRRLLPASKEEQRRRFFEEVDAQNAQLYGGWPTVTRQFLGELKLRSGTLAIGDPQHLPDPDGVRRRQMVRLRELRHAHPVTSGEAAKPVALADDMGASQRCAVRQDYPPRARVRLRPGHIAALVQRMVY